MANQHSYFNIEPSAFHRGQYTGWDATGAKYTVRKYSVERGWKAIPRELGGGTLPILHGRTLGEISRKLAEAGK